jgi:alginate O-acetyltransferase complex protein AlgI
MLFNSLTFAIFLPLVFALYWGVAVRNLRLRNAFLVVASYVFYGWWDWRFLSLIILSSVIDYTVGIGLGKTDDAWRRKWLLGTSVVANLGILGVFKYLGFFAESLQGCLGALGMKASFPSLHIILPVGISFYTFQTMSYTIDVYRRKLEPTRDIAAFLAFVSFFPQLVAGPIERATNLLPQFSRTKPFCPVLAWDGVLQIAWGLFKKIVIADNCATYVNSVFSRSDPAGSAVVLAAVFFSFQIYGDFSGYSDIAIGTGKLFGFSLMTNFRVPYFSRNIAEFWRRWHISLSTWFRDYVYIPIGGSRCSLLRQVRNVFVVFLVSALWHGANWTFVVWGLIHAALFLPGILLKRNRAYLDTAAQGRLFPSVREACQIAATFGCVCIAWIFFRAQSLAQAGYLVSRVFTHSLFEIPHPEPSLVLVLVAFVFVEWTQRDARHQFDLSHLPPLPRRLAYASLATLVIVMGNFFSPAQFIYFQF